MNAIEMMNKNVQMNTLAVLNNSDTTVTMTQILIGVGVAITLVVGVVALVKYFSNREMKNIKKSITKENYLDVFKD